jgi:hypothetical protein
VGEGRGERRNTGRATEYRGTGYIPVAIHWRWVTLGWVPVRNCGGKQSFMETGMPHPEVPEHREPAGAVRNQNLLPPHQDIT